MKKLILIASVVVAGCAQMYTPPTTLSPSTIDHINAQTDVVFNAANRALVANGYQVTSTDANAGIISTAPRDLRLAPEQADCGTVMGIDYLKDNRTSTRVAFGIIVTDAKIEVKTTIQGEYKSGGGSGGQSDIVLTCVSRGGLERDMLAKIRSEVR
jgi:hypothetical protein